MSESSAWHVLHVKENDPEYPGEDTEYSVTCPHGRTDYDRDCVMWFECGCTSADPCEDDQQCPKSPTGEHQMVIGGPAALCRPSKLCFVADNENLSDAAADLSPGPGDHPVSYEAKDFEYLSLELIVNEAVL